MSSTVEDSFNASNMSDSYKEMQAEIKKHYKYADYCPCAINLLNLAGESATCCCFESAIFFRISMNFIIFFGIYLSLKSHEEYP